MLLALKETPPIKAIRWESHWDYNLFMIEALTLISQDLGLPVESLTFIESSQLVVIRLVDGTALRMQKDDTLVFNHSAFTVYAPQEREALFRIVVE